MVSIFGRGDAVGRDAQSALGSLMGTDLVDNWGPGGLGIVGARRGGGGTGDGTYGFGPLGTIGLCRGPNCGPGTGHGYPPGIGGMPLTRRPSGPEAVGGQAKVIGGLDREIIRRTIRAHIKEVKFCYERELIRKPGLFGRVSVQFTITGMGAVSSAAVASSTIGDANVEGCITAAVRRWEFPHPENGGIVHVTYPFVLQAAGGAR
jgi:TonB family protein